MLKRYLVVGLVCGTTIIIAKQQKQDIVYSSNIPGNKTIIRNIEVKGCSKGKQQLIKSTLKINPGDIINLQSTVINSNIKNILENCSFVQNIQSTYKIVDEHNIDLVFTVEEAPLIIDIEFNNINNENLKKHCEKDCFIKSCNDSYINKLKQQLLRLAKKGTYDNYQIYVTEGNKKLTEGKKIIINKIDFFRDKTQMEILTYLSSLNEYRLRKMFGSKYGSVKKVIEEFCQMKEEYSLRTDTSPLTDETIISTIKDKKMLQYICKQHFVKIIISRQSSEVTKDIIEGISFEGNKLLKTKQILKDIGFLHHKTCFKSIISLIKNLKIQTLFNDISSLFKTYFLHKTNSETIDSYKNKIIDLYRRCGFINVQITKIDIIKNTTSNNILVTYHIDEGQPFFINSIKIMGNRTFKEQYLCSLIKLSPGDAFDAQKLHDSIWGTAINMMMDGLKALYNNHGFLNCHISIKTEYTDNKVDITVQINEGEKSKIGIVRFYGNKYTDENYFKSYVVLYPSEYFAVDKLAMSQQGLVQSEFLHKEKLFINPIKNDTMENTQDIDCTIKERFLPKLNVNANFDPRTGESGGLKISLIAGFNNLNLAKLFHITDPQFKWIGKRHNIDLNISVMPSSGLQNFKEHTYDMTFSTSIPEMFKFFKRDVGFGSNFSLNQCFSHFDNDKDEETDNNDATKEIVRSINLNTHFMWTNFNRTQTFTLGIMNINYKWNKAGPNEPSKKILDIPITVGFRFSNIDKSFFVTRGVDFNISSSFINPALAFINNDIFKKNIKTIIYLGLYYPLSKKIVINFANYFGAVKSIFDKRPNYFRLGSGILETYMPQMQYTEFFLRGIDEEDIDIQFFNKSQCQIAYKTNLELRLKIIEISYFGLYVFGFFNGGTMFFPTNQSYYNTVYDSSQNKYYPFFSATGIGIKLNVPIIGVLGWALGFDMKTGNANISFTLRQDFETIF